MVKHLFVLFSFPLFLLLSACSSVSGPLAGELEVRITGLPDGVQANVVALGPEGKSLSFAASGVKPAPVGDWIVEARSVEVEGKRYTAQVNPAQVKVEYGKRARVEVVYSLDEATRPGSVYVKVSGLPEGVEATGYLEGPDGREHEWTGTKLLPSLPPGPYRVVANPVEGYEVSVDPEFFTLPPGGTQEVQVVYAERRELQGSLAVQISGLPRSGLADVRVTGPGGYSSGRLTGSTVLEDLTPGTYVVEAYPVEVDGKDYRPTVRGSPAEVRAGAQAQVEVVYEVDRQTLPGTVYIQVQGLPAGLEGRGKLFGPDDLQISWTGTIALSDLPPGSYLVEAYPVEEYEPQVNPSSFTLAPGGSQTVQVVYARRVSQGSLLIRVEGLPDPDAAELLVEGPGGYEQRLYGPDLLEGLTPGTYVVSAYRVVAGSGVYEPLVSSKSVEVQAGETAEVVMGYRLVQETGSLMVQVQGLPGPDLADIEVVGPDGYSQHLTDTALLEDLVPGTYAVSAYPITVDGQRYNPTVQGSPAQVEPGGTATVIITYEPENSSPPPDGG